MKRLIPLCLLALLGACAGAPPVLPQHSFDIHATADKPTASTRTLADPQGQAVLVIARAELTQRDVQRAEVVLGNGGRPGVLVTFAPAASKRLAQMTEKQRGKALAVVIDGQLRMLPQVSEPVRDGRVMLEGFDSQAEAEVLARQLNGLRDVPAQP